MILFLTILAIISSIIVILKIRESEKRYREEFPPGWEEELKRKYYEKHPEEQPV